MNAYNRIKLYSLLYVYLSQWDGDKKMPQTQLKAIKFMAKDTDTYRNILLYKAGYDAEYEAFCII